MALKTLSTDSLYALVQNVNLIVADAATVRANIQWDWDYVNGAYTRIRGGAAFPGGYELQGGQGLLHVPRRGVLKVLPGDYVAYDPNGWPILVSGGSINKGTGWTHS